MEENTIKMNLAIVFLLLLVSLIIINFHVFYQREDGKRLNLIEMLNNYSYDNKFGWENNTIKNISVDGEQNNNFSLTQIKCAGENPYVNCTHLENAFKYELVYEGNFFNLFIKPYHLKDGFYGVNIKFGNVLEQNYVFYENATCYRVNSKYLASKENSWKSCEGIYPFWIYCGKDDKNMHYDRDDGILTEINIKNVSLKLISRREIDG